MGSDDDRKRKKKDKKKDRKKSRDRKDRDRYSDSDSSESEEVRRKKKIKKSQDKDTSSFTQPKFMYGQEHGRQHYHPFAPPQFFMPHIMEIAPPPPTAPAATTLSKPTKNKEPNIFKLLPLLPPSVVTLCNCLYSTELLGSQNLELIIGKLWKMLDKKMKPIATKRITKIINEGITLHEKLINSKDKDNKPTPMTVEMQKQPSFTDFDVIAAIFQKTPIQDIKSMLGTGSLFTEADLQPTFTN